MNEQLWNLLNARDRDLQARMDVLENKWSEFHNDSIESSLAKTDITELTRENEKLREENAKLAATQPDTPANPYGYELILDLHRCDHLTFTRKSIRAFCRKLCLAVDMKPCQLHFWDDVGVPEAEQQTSPHTKGTSAVQFILTSSIVIHTLDLLDAVYVNIFSCKLFDPLQPEQFTKEWFRAKECRSRFIVRTGPSSTPSTPSTSSTPSTRKQKGKREQ